MVATVEVRVPDIGDFNDIPVIELLVKAGDSVKEDESVVTLESDKATLDVTMGVAGRVVTLAVAAGTRVSQGSLIMTVDAENAEGRQGARSAAPVSDPAGPKLPISPAPPAAHRCPRQWGRTMGSGVARHRVRQSLHHLELHDRVVR